VHRGVVGRRRLHEIRVTAHGRMASIDEGERT